jgi:hypothetical protein
VAFKASTGKKWSWVDLDQISGIDVLSAADPSSSTPVGRAREV